MNVNEKLTQAQAFWNARIAPHLPEARRVLFWIVLFATLVYAGLSAWSTTALAFNNSLPSQVVPGLMGLWSVMALVIASIYLPALRNNENRGTFVSAILLIWGLGLLTALNSIELRFQLSVPTVLTGTVGAVAFGVLAPRFLWNANSNREFPAHRKGVEIMRVAERVAWYGSAPITGALFWYLCYQGASKVLVGGSTIFSVSHQTVGALVVATLALIWFYSYAFELATSGGREHFHQKVLSVLVAGISNFLVLAGVFHILAPTVSDPRALAWTQIGAVAAVYAFVVGGMYMMAELMPRTVWDVEDLLRRVLNRPPAYRPWEERPYEVTEDDGGGKPQSEADTPRQGGGDKPHQGGGDKPHQGGGDKPRQGGGEQPRQGGGDKPRQGGGEQPRQGGGDKPHQGGGDRQRQGGGDKPN